jgi:hypothetical protein
MTILPKPVSRRKKITRKKTLLEKLSSFKIQDLFENTHESWKNCQVSENSKNDIRTTPK